MPREQNSMQRVLAAFRGRVGKDGTFDIESRAVGIEIGKSGGYVRNVALRFEDTGVLERVCLGRYRLTGKPYGRTTTHRVDRVCARPAEPAAPLPPPLRSATPCSYALSRSLGIEPSIRTVFDHSPPPGVHMQRVAVSVARVPFLERPLPPEVA